MIRDRIDALPDACVSFVAKDKPFPFWLKAVFVVLALAGAAMLYGLSGI